MSAFLVLAQAVGTAVSSPPATNADAIERLGVAGLLVVAAYFLIRYFMGLLEKKEARLTDVTDRFIEATERHTEVVAEFKQEVRELRLSNEGMAGALTELKGALRREPRS